MEIVFTFNGSNILIAQMIGATIACYLWQKKLLTLIAFVIATFYGSWKIVALMGVFTLLQGKLDVQIAAMIISLAFTFIFSYITVFFLFKIKLPR